MYSYVQRRLGVFALVPRRDQLGFQMQLKGTASEDETLEMNHYMHNALPGQPDQYDRLVSPGSKVPQDRGHARSWPAEP